MPVMLGSLAGDGHQPGDIPGRGWCAILRQVRHALACDHIWVAAAGVAFCTLFATIPGVTVVLAVLGSAVDPATVHRQLELTSGLLPAETSRFLADQMQAVAAASRFHLGGALLVALWSARTGAATLISVFNIAYGEQESRGFLRYQAVLLTMTAALCLFGLLALLLVAVLPVAADILPLGQGARIAISLGRWPALALLMAVALAATYRFAPCRSQPRWHWVSLGAVVATALWLASLAAFSTYVAHFPFYSQIFGVLGAVMLLMTWFYLTAFAVLLGAELNAAMERQGGQTTTQEAARPSGQPAAMLVEAASG